MVEIYSLSRFVTLENIKDAKSKQAKGALSRSLQLIA